MGIEPSELGRAGLVQLSDGSWAKVDLSRRWTPSEVAILKAAYIDPRRSVDINVIAKGLNRSHAAVALKASELGLTNGERCKTSAAVQKSSETRRRQWHSLSPEMRSLKTNHLIKDGSYWKGRKHTPETKDILSQRAKHTHANQPHPKGMLGKAHSLATKELISSKTAGQRVPAERVLRMLKTKSERGILITPRPVSWKQGWRVIGGQRIYARSRWEANYARALEFLRKTGVIQEWKHEPETFWFDKVQTGTRCYTPDFKVTYAHGAIEYHEVKGWMDRKSRTKLSRMGVYYPGILVRVIDQEWFKGTGKTFRRLCPDWEG